VEHHISDAAASYLVSADNRIVPAMARLQALGWCPEVTPEQAFKRMSETLV
jgi:hypothetical protein